MKSTYESSWDAICFTKKSSTTNCRKSNHVMCLNRIKKGIWPCYLIDLSYAKPMKKKITTLYHQFVSHYQSEILVLPPLDLNSQMVLWHKVSVSSMRVENTQGYFALPQPVNLRGYMHMIYPDTEIYCPVASLSTSLFPLSVLRKAVGHSNNNHPILSHTLCSDVPAETNTQLLP
jgi:ribosomal protein L37AE/L43A